MGTPRWQMLPGGLLQESGSEAELARDWIVDVTMLAVALAVGTLALGGTEEQHPPTGWSSSTSCVGLAALVPLWWRRRYPFAVALLTIDARVRLCVRRRAQG